MENSSNARVVTIKKMCDIFVHRWYMILIVAVISVGSCYVVSNFVLKPRYQSTATLYILKQNETDSNHSSDDFSLALMVVNDCDYLLKSHSVLDKVIEELNLNVTYEDLSKTISTSNPDSTRILEVTVEADSPEEAKRIVDSVCKVGTQSIAQAMSFQQVNFYEYGTLETEPCNHLKLSAYLLIGLVAVVLSYTFFLLLFLLDDTIRTDEDIQRYMGLTVLGDIPNADGITGKKGYEHYAAYGNRQKISPSNKGDGRK